MNIQPIKFYSPKNNIVLQKTNSVANSETVNYKNSEYSLGFKNYAITSPNFKSYSVQQSRNIKLNLTDKPVAPLISIEITPNKDINTKQGIFPVYKMALNDQMYQELCKNQNIKDNNSYIKPESRKIIFQCPEDEFQSVLKMINNRFVNMQIDKDFVENAKILAPVLYFLYTRTGENADKFQDIPEGLSEEEYTEIVNKITYEDVINYNKNILANSEINIELTVNKDYFQKNKHEIIHNLNGKPLV